MVNMIFATIVGYLLWLRLIILDYTHMSVAAAADDTKPIEASNTTVNTDQTC